MDLAKFLEARIDDDEAAAKAAFGPGIALNWPALPAAVDVFVDRYGPLRAVREVDAKRKIVAEAQAVRKLLDLTGGEQDRYPDWVLRQMAAVWSDHPDFDPAWKE